MGSHPGEIELCFSKLLRPYAPTGVRRIDDDDDDEAGCSSQRGCTVSIRSVVFSRQY